MADDRAADLKRVYKLPASHVKTHANLDEQPSGYERNRLYSMKARKSKVDSNNQTDEQRNKSAKHDMDEIKYYNDTQAGGRPLKIKS